MSETPGADPAIRISYEEVRAPRIDEQLVAQQGFGLGAPQDAAAKTRLIYKPWFALMLAGLVGALVSWVILEPIVDDGIRYKARVQAINTDLQAGLTDVFTALVTLGDLRILVGRETQILDESGQPIREGDLRSGDALEALLGTVEADNGSIVYIATYIRKLGPSAGLTTTEEMASYRFKRILAGFLFFPLTAGLIGLCVGATDGILSRAWGRAAFAAAIGVAVGFFAGLITLIPTTMIFGIGSSLAQSLNAGQSMRLGSSSLLVLIMARGLAWAVAGCAAGVGQGIAMRSKKLFLNGLIGGTVGALFGGVFFDPINLMFENLNRTGGAEISRMCGLGLIGACTGFMIGIVELLARESWVKLLTGPIAGKEFILYRNPTWIGSSPKSEIYLFKDAQVAPRHAAIHRAGEHYEIEDCGAEAGTLVTGQRVRRRRLRDRDRIQIGQTTMEFRVREE